jgi:hypothetical protein
VDREASKHSPFMAACEVDGASFTIGAEDGDVINVAVQLLDASGQPLRQAGSVDCWLASAAAGLPLATAPDTLAIGTHGMAIEEISNSKFTALSNATGLFDVNIGKTGAATYYLVVRKPTGTIVVSSAITFA